MLLAITVRGTFVFLLTWLLDRAFRGRMSARSRRVWWVVVPVSFLLPAGLPLFPAPAVDHDTVAAAFSRAGDPGVGADGLAAASSGFFSISPGSALAAVWLLGVVAYLAVVIIRTARSSRHWSRIRLSTDEALLSLLEDCKEKAGVTAPIGIAVAGDIPAPALLGWLRPRILLPEAFVFPGQRETLRAVLLHELAHFRSLDIPLHWLQTLACAVHWFNPFAHLGARAWMRFREEAADEAAIIWFGGDGAEDYGEAFVNALKHSRIFSLPFGSSTVVKFNQNHKQRMIMILNHAKKTPRAHLAAVVALALTVAATVLPVQADNSATPAQPDTSTQSIDGWPKAIDASLTIVIEKNGNIRFNGKQATVDQLAVLLHQVKTISRDTPVLISVEENTPIKAVVFVVDVCRKIGLSKLSLQSW
ncbi:M56 family metallopeptidase [Ereboglobus luteus]|nr:M56 family metallopeptidase [Ereboglobus luteus]